MKRLLLLAVIPLLILSRSTAVAQSPSANRFGVIESYEEPRAAAQLGAGWTRVRLHWATIQPQDDSSWTPLVPEEKVRAEAAAGIEVVGLLIGIPDWARGDDLLPKGLWLPPDDPANLWANFVRAAVTRYAGSIDHWIIWNEPDIWDKNTPGHSWDGDERDFAQLLKTAYLVAKETNPNSVIHLPAMTYYWDANFGREQYLGKLLDILLADESGAQYNYYFDVATAHLYFQPGSIYDITAFFVDMFRQRGLNHPMWLVETNAPPIDDPAWLVDDPTFLVTQFDQAAFQPQAIAAGLAAGAERVAIYKLKDIETDLVANPEPFGLLRMDGSARPAFSTAQVAFALLADVTEAERTRWDDIGIFRLTHPDQETTLLFARAPGPRQAVVPAISDSAFLIDMWGERNLIHPVDGFYMVDLPAAPCNQFAGEYCMIGGETFYLMQPIVPEPAPTPSMPTLSTTPQVDRSKPGDGKSSLWMWLFSFIVVSAGGYLFFRKTI